eukprot:3449480-Pyramimonas_sp.AAC.1
MAATASAFSSCIAFNAVASHAQVNLARLLTAACTTTCCHVPEQLLIVTFADVGVACVFRGGLLRPGAFSQRGTDFQQQTTCSCKGLGCALRVLS